MKLFITPWSLKILYRKVVAGELDAAVISLSRRPRCPKICDWTLWREEPFVVLTPRAMKDANAHRIFQPWPFIRDHRNQLGGRLADKYLQHVKIKPQDRYEIRRRKPSPFWWIAALACCWCRTGRSRRRAACSCARLPCRSHLKIACVGLLDNGAGLTRRRMIKALAAEAPRFRAERRPRD